MKSNLPNKVNNKFKLLKKPNAESNVTKLSFNNPIFKKIPSDLPNKFLKNKKYREESECVYSSKVISRNQEDLVLSIEKYDQLSSNFCSSDLEYIEYMWEDLGIVTEYKEIFRGLLTKVDDVMKKDLLAYESKTLKSIVQLLIKITKDITYREKSIKNINKIVDIVKLEKLKNNLLNELIIAFKSVRILSINIVNHISKLRELTSYSILCNKLDFSKLSKKFLYDKNYLVKVILYITVY